MGKLERQSSLMTWEPSWSVYIVTNFLDLRLYISLISSKISTRPPGMTIDSNRFGKVVYKMMSKKISKISIKNPCELIREMRKNCIDAKLCIKISFSKI